MTKHAPVPRTERVWLRCTIFEKEKIEAAAERDQRSVSDYIRVAALKHADQKQP